MTHEKKRTLIAVLLGISTLFNVIFLVFAFVQKASADESRIEAQVMQLKLMEVQRLVQEQRALAEVSMKQAEEAHALAEKARKDCEEKSKLKK